MDQENVPVFVRREARTKLIGGSYEREERQFRLESCEMNCLAAFLVTIVDLLSSCGMNELEMFSFQKRTGEGAAFLRLAGWLLNTLGRVCSGAFCRCLMLPHGSWFLPD
jgi:hypothetical protein